MAGIVFKNSPYFLHYSSQNPKEAGITITYFQLTHEETEMVQ